MISVIIPNLNGEEYLGACLEGLAEQTCRDFDVIIVDNGSTDRSLELAAEFGDRLHLTEISYDCNYGFAKAVNEGIRSSGAEYVLLLNNDTIPGKQMVEHLYKAISEHPEAFSVQALMLQMRNRHKVDSAGDYFTCMGWARSVGRNRAAYRYTEKKSRATEPVETIFSACAGAAIYRRSILSEIGFFDEEYFAYLEDVDIGYRARLAGYKNYLAPHARVLHIGSAGSYAENRNQKGTGDHRHNSFKVKLSARNALLTCYKNMTNRQLAINMLPIVLGILIKTVYFTAKGLGRDYIEGVISAFGKFPVTERVNFEGVSADTRIELQRELWRNVLKMLR